MTITPEQFNKIALRSDTDQIASDLQEFKLEMTQFRGEVLQVLDGIVKKLDDIKSDSVANLAAHDRFEAKFIDLEKHLL